jgi:hypothetical protein
MAITRHSEFEPFTEKWRAFEFTTMLSCDRMRDIYQIICHNRDPPVNALQHAPNARDKGDGAVFMFTVRAPSHIYRRYRL